MQHYDVILFDVDGTLIDSAPGILNTLEEVFTVDKDSDSAKAAGNSSSRAISIRKSRIRACTHSAILKTAASLMKFTDFKNFRIS